MYFNFTYIGLVGIATFGLAYLLPLTGMAAGAVAGFLGVFIAALILKIGGFDLMEIVSAISGAVGGAIGYAVGGSAVTSSLGAAVGAIVVNQIYMQASGTAGFIGLRNS